MSLEVSISKKEPLFVRLSVFHVHVDITLSKCPLVRKSLCLLVSLSGCVNAMNDLALDPLNLREMTLGVKIPWDTRFLGA